MKVGFIGMTHLGLVYSLASAAHGFSSMGFTLQSDEVSRLASGNFPISEPGFLELWKKHRDQLEYTSDFSRLGECELVFVAMDVPTLENQEADLRSLDGLLGRIIPQLSKTSTLILLCQVPPGYTRSLLNRSWNGIQLRTNQLFYQVETLAFGMAVERAMEPERYIIGVAQDKLTLNSTHRLWLESFGCPILKMRYESAELAKISINLMLIASVSASNMLAEICEEIGADWHEIVPALRMDRRIGAHAYLQAGLGISGGNLERDMAAIRKMGVRHGTEVGMIDASFRNSNHRKQWILRKVREASSGKEGFILGVLGLAYKQDTHSTKNSPSVAMLRALPEMSKKGYDPEAVVEGVSNFQQVSERESAIRGVDALVVATPWSEFKELKPSGLAELMRGRVVIDPYRLFDADACQAAGLLHHRIGVKSPSTYE